MRISRKLISRVEALPDNLRNQAMDNVDDARHDLTLWPHLRLRILEDLEKAIGFHEKAALEGESCSACKQKNMVPVTEYVTVAEGEAKHIVGDQEERS